MKLSKKAQEALNKVTEQFKKGDLSAVVEIAKTRVAEDAPMSQWSFSNRVIAYAQSESFDCRGYQQWKKAGRQVQKGQSGSFILAPTMIKVDEDGEEKSICVGFRAIPVFGYHQTDGDKDSEVVYEPKDLPLLADVAEKLGIETRWHPTDEGNLGTCTVDGKKIDIGTQDTGVFFHELAHAVHARIEGKLNGGQHIEQETVAEFASCVLMSLYGLGDRSGNAWKYISMYAKNPVAAVAKALSTVEKILQVIEGV